MARINAVSIRLVAAALAALAVLALTACGGGGGDAAPAAPVVTLSAPPSGNVAGTVTVSATVDTHPVAINGVEFFAGSTSLGTDTTAPYSVQWDTTRFANGMIALRATATDANGTAGSSPQVSVSVANAVAATLAQIQAQVFTPACTRCHDGSQPPNGSLPGSLNLNPGSSFASLVNVASLEQPSVLRVRPGEPDNSYLIRKLEGSAGISGQRMPLGGPFLDQATIDSIRSWIGAGAPDN